MSHIDKVLELYGGDIKAGAKTPTSTGLFSVDKDSPPLEEGKRKIFHSVFATLLWVGTMVRPDILVALSYLGKRTTKANDDDEKKLERLLSYIKATCGMPLTLGIDNLQVKSFDVHEDMKSHSGLLGSFGLGAIFAKSVTQRLNATSSTKSEVIACSEVLPQALWTTSFLHHQGFKIKKALIHQDNEAAMLLEGNGVNSRKR
jgi:hypothetical protein